MKTGDQELGSVSFFYDRCWPTPVIHITEIHAQ
jgi:hypothetical protein